VLRHPNLKDHIFEYPLLSEHECDQIVTTLDEADNWDEFMWYSNDYEHVDVDKQSQLKSTINHTVTEVIQPHINNELFNAFHAKYHDSDITNGDSFWENCSGIKFNKYSVGDYLSPHHDHIRDFFEGQFRGIPVTSVVGVLNDDFEGGEFVFWREHSVKIKKGHVLAFPALYLFPHEVTPVTSGVRYSWITWIV
jgi:predicted 2-oxoglutarate/Fe(II)-dependent dioxygenase YbiX